MMSVEEEGGMTNETEAQPTNRVESPTRHADAALSAIDALLDNPTQTAADMSYGVDAGGCWRCNMGDEEVDELGLCAFCRGALRGDGDAPPRRMSTPRRTPLRDSPFQRALAVTEVEMRRELESNFYTENSLYARCRAMQTEHRIWSRELMAKVRSLHTTMRVPDEMLASASHPAREVPTDTLIRAAADRLSVVIHPRDCRVEIIRSDLDAMETTLTAHWSPTTHNAELHGGPADKLSIAIPGDRFRVSVPRPPSLDLYADPSATSPEFCYSTVTYLRDGWNQATRCWVFRPESEVNARG